jgi:lysophospholipase L1-like esterase
MYRRSFRGAALVLLLAAACGGSHTPAPTPIVVTPDPPAPPPPPPTPPPVLGVTRILAFGDSMTAGTVSAPLPSLFARLDAGLPVSYPFKLQTLATSRYTGQSIVVLNAGKAGESATDSTTRTRFNSALSEAKPEVLLLMEGANDLNGVTPSSTATVNAMEDMVRDAQGRGIFVMLATIPPQRPGPGSKTTTPALLTRYNNDLRTMAAKKGAQLVDVNALFPLSLIGQDGLHPTDAGYDKLAEIFLDAIKAKYEKPQAP